MEEDVTIDYEQLTRDYERFYEYVIQCYTYLVAGEHTKAHDLISLTTGMAMGLAVRIGLHADGTKRSLKPPQQHTQLTVEQLQPWRAIGISRSTYYRDQRRSKLNDAHAPQQAQQHGNDHDNE